MITAVLLGVIAVTLLNPGEDPELFGVDVPGPGESTVQSPPSYEPGVRERDDEPQTDDVAASPPELALTGPSAPGAAALGTEADGAAPTDATPPQPAPSDDGPNGDGDGSPGPPGEQYGDTLARLDDALD